LEADPRQALRWFRAAAERGHAVAQFYLGELYRKGEGTQRDLVEAYRWFVIARDQGITDAHARVRELLPLMSSVQIAEGNKRALDRP